ncbi:hypothetical protein ES703_68436 [subsurface metagenome]
MLSRTTIELSTSMPIPRASPPKDMILRETPERNIRKKAAATEMGIARLMITVLRKLRR